MAVFETNWTDFMNPASSTIPSSPSRSSYDSDLRRPSSSMTDGSARDPNPPTVAQFSAGPSSTTRASYHQVFSKSPLLATTPPQITRALSQAYPYMRALNWLVGLITWTTADPWESFLLVAVFWGISLYGDFLLVWAGNVLVVCVLILGMFLRNHVSVQQHEHPSLDEIVSTLTILTTRMNILTAPFADLTTFLSTGQTAVKATTQPALTNLFIRILFVSPAWLALTCLPPYLITPRRVLLFTGTVIMTWHSRPATVARTVLWRSAIVRRVSESITGLNLSTPVAEFRPALPPRTGTGHKRTPSAIVASTLASKSSPLSTRGTSPGVKFTFSIYENQRRWLGVGWTSSLFAYERAAWTDEHLNPCPSIEEFTLPDASKNGMRWRWIPGEDWRVDGEEPISSPGGKRAQELKDRLGANGDEGRGWVYYDNKWRDGKRGADGWGKYTRRRRFVRNAELVEEDETDVVVDDTRPGIVIEGEEGDYEHSEEGRRTREKFAKEAGPVFSETSER